MQRTPWTKAKGSLPADRLKPSIPKSPSNASKSKGNGKQQSSQPPKSREVKRLESLIRAIRDTIADEKDPKGGCFCLARVHPLSPHTPICRSCGLIICSVNQPQYCCPHCLKTLMTDNQRESIINQIDLQLASTIAQEEEQKQRALEEERKVIGAFPSLSGSPAPESSISTPAARQTHKVMSFKQNKKVLISSYTAALPVSKTDELEDEPERIPPPPPEPLFSRVLPTRDRPWENLTKGASTYIPNHRLDNDGNSRSHRKRNKGKKQENYTEQGDQDDKKEGNVYSAS